MGATSTNTSPSAPLTALAHTGTNPIEPTFIQTAPQSQPDPPSYASLDSSILEKDPRTFTMEDTVALKRSLKRKAASLKQKEANQ